MVARITITETKIPPAVIFHGLPAPETEFCFHPTRKWRFDFCWPKFMTALEVEGAVWTQGRHTRGSGFLADMKKYNEAALLGWAVLRCTPKDINSGAARALVRRALLSRIKGTNPRAG